MNEVTWQGRCKHRILPNVCKNVRNKVSLALNNIPNKF